MGRPSWKSRCRPRIFGGAFIVYGWSSRVARATRRPSRAALRLACRQGMLELRLQSRGCVFVAVVTLGHVVDDVLLLV